MLLLLTNLPLFLPRKVTTARDADSICERKEGNLLSITSNDMIIIQWPTVSGRTKGKLQPQLRTRGESRSRKREEEEVGRRMEGDAWRDERVTGARQAAHEEASTHNREHEACRPLARVPRSSGERKRGRKARERVTR